MADKPLLAEALGSTRPPELPAGWGVPQAGLQGGLQSPGPRPRLSPHPARRCLVQPPGRRSGGSDRPRLVRVSCSLSTHEWTAPGEGQSGA